MENDGPLEGGRGQRAVFVVGGAALECDLLTNAELGVRGRTIDGRLGFGVAGIDGEGGGVGTAATVVDGEGDGSFRFCRVLVLGFGAGTVGGAVAEVPVVGEGIAVGVAAGATVEFDGERHLAEGLVGGGAGDRRTVRGARVEDLPELTAVVVGGVVEGLGG